MEKTNISKRNNRDRGTTLVEIVVSFALLGIFMACAATIIALISNLYFDVKRETYAKQVSDIVLEKIASTIEGAKYDKDVATSNPEISSDYKKITLRDRTDTKVTIYSQDEEIRFFYAQIDDQEDENDRNATIWRFDEGMYNGFTVKNLYFVPGDKLGNYSSKVAEYGMNTSGVQYGDDVVVVFLKLSSAQYGDYYFYRVVKMYYVPETS